MNGLGTYVVIVIGFLLIIFLIQRVLAYRLDRILGILEEHDNEKEIPTPFYPLFSQSDIESLHDDWTKIQHDLKRQNDKSAEMIEKEKKEFEKDQETDLEKDRRFKPSIYLRSLMEKTIEADSRAKKAEERFRAALEANLAILQGKKTLLEAQREFNEKEMGLMTREKLDSRHKQLNDWIQNLSERASPNAT
jgi:hypothetical protein